MNQKLKILLVDDAKVQVDLMVLMIQKEFECLPVYSGAQALELLESQTPDLIVTDILMPEMNGIELIQKIQEKEIKTPIIILSGDRDEKNKKKARELGIEHILEKPFDKKQFKECIRQLLDLPSD